MFALAGGLFLVSANSSDGTDLRPGRVTDLPSLVRAESQELEELKAKAADLNDEVDRLASEVPDADVRRAQALATARQDVAGFEEVHGDGLTVTLADAPDELREDAPDISRLLVHQQDIQAVVNAMWNAGARAITIQGQRVITTTGIKCAGNSVELHGIPYAQPYVITGIGDPDTLRAGIQSSPYLQLYREDAENPDIQVGWSVEEEHDITAPAYTGLRTLQYAEPLQQ